MKESKGSIRQLPSFIALAFVLSCAVALFVSPSLALAQDEETSTADRIESAADEVVGTHDKVDVQYEEDAQKALLIIEDEEVFSGPSAIRDAYEYFVGWGQEISDMEEVETLEVDLRTTYTDQMGEESIDTLIRITMDVDNFSEFNWENLEGRPIHNQLRENGNLYIHPATARDVDLEEDTHLPFVSDSDSDDEGCFIATAAYGTPTEEDIDTLRDFRDTRLKGNALGDTFVDMYYEYGPSAAEYVSERDGLRYYVREFQIKPIVAVLENTESLWK